MQMILFCHATTSSHAYQVHEEFTYGFSEQLLRARATDQVLCATLAFNSMHLLCSTVWNQHAWLPQVSTAAHQTADQVQQKSKRITENVRHQVKYFTSSPRQSLTLQPQIKHRSDLCCCSGTR